jgi:hypothetical protein
MHQQAQHSTAQPSPPPPHALYLIILVLTLLLVVMSMLLLQQRSSAAAAADMYSPHALPMHRTANTQSHAHSSGYAPADTTDLPLAAAQRAMLQEMLRQEVAAVVRDQLEQQHDREL